MSLDWFADIARQLSEQPVIQGLLVALCTFILEDPTTVGSGLLVADGWMRFSTAIIGLTAGIAIGDLGLYGLGRLLGPRCVAWGLVSEERLAKAGDWANKNLVTVIVAARFVPGTRFPTYVGAGIVRASAVRFFLVALAASLVWTLILVLLTVQLGRAFLPMLGRWKWPVALGVVALLVGLQFWARRRARKRRDFDSRTPPPAGNYFEYWPAWLFYIPVALYYVWLALKHRGLTLPTCANPSIYSGGVIGESKSEILSLVPDRFRDVMARHVSFTKPANDVPIEEQTSQALAAIHGAGLGFPIVAKPDHGQRGAGVQLLRSEAQLAEYLGRFPGAIPIVFQEFADHPHEAGILYFRKPDEERGTISSVTRKHFPAVRGDGRRTLRELILADPRARRIRHVHFAKHANQLDRVLEDGEEFRLVFAGNHCQGAIFTDGRELITPALEDRINEIASAIPEFYFGRFDVRFEAPESLMCGEKFKIVEINGAAAEATHIWDSRTRLTEAYRAYFWHLRRLFEIAAVNRRRGFRPMPAGQLYREILEYYRLARGYPPTS